MWTRLHCPACGAATWSPAAPGAAWCAECGAVVPPRPADVLRTFDAPGQTAALKAKPRSGKTDALIIGGLFAFLGAVIAGAAVAPWGNDEAPRDRLPAKQADAPTPDDTPEKAPGPPAESAVPKPAPPKPTPLKSPADGPVWTAYTDGKAGFRVEFPVFVAGPTTAPLGSGRDGGRVSLAVAGGTTMEVQHEAYALEKTEEELLQLGGVNYRSRAAVTRKDITLGAHPGVEFAAAATLTGQKKAVRSRVVVAGRRLYQISVVTDPDGTVPAAGERFLNSFRLLGEPAAVVEVQRETWRECSSPAGKFTVSMPGRATELQTKLEVGFDVSSRVVDDLGTAFTVQSKPLRGDPRGGWLEADAVVTAAKFAEYVRPVRIDGHPGFDFSAAKTPDGQPKTIRSRVYAVDEHLIQLSVVSDPKLSVSDKAVDRFFASFRPAKSLPMRPGPIP